MKYVPLVCFVALLALTGVRATAPICAGECMVHHEVSFNDRFTAVDYTTPVPHPMGIGVSSAPTTTTTTISGGDLAAQIIEWLKLAFGTVIAGIGTQIIIKIRTYFGILTTDAQKAQLQALAVNAVNAAASKAEDTLRANPHLDIDVKNAVVQDAVSYVQAHGSDVIKALGLDPKSGDAVDAIKARIATAMNSDQTPTITATTITPNSGVVA
jgi:hypothetical protein